MLSIYLVACGRLEGGRGWGGGDKELIKHNIEHLYSLYIPFIQQFTHALSIRTQKQIKTLLTHMKTYENLFNAT